MTQFVRFVSIVLMAVGAGLLIYGLSVDVEQYRRPAGIALLQSPSECAAWGGGLLVGGTLFLVFFGRGGKKKAGKG